MIYTFVHSRVPNSGSSASVSSAPSNTLYIDSVSSSVSQDDLTAMCSKLANVDNVR